MKKSIRTIGILLVVISMIFAFVNMGLLQFNWFKMLANGTAEFKNDVFETENIKTINVNVPSNIVEYVLSDDDKIHFVHISSDKFAYNILSTESSIEVNVTDRLEWYDHINLYKRFTIVVAIPKGIQVQIYENGALVQEVLD